MTTNKKIVICTLLILTMFSLMGIVSASDSVNDNLEIKDTSQNSANVDNSQSSLTDTITTSATDNKKEIKTSKDSYKKSTHTTDTKNKTNQKDLTVNTDTSINLLNDSTSQNTGTVYVSTDGDDANEGSQDKKVKTIKKAITIATSTGNGQIIVSNGTYTEHDLEITKDLNINGQGNVILDAQKLGRIFNLTNKSKLVLKNLKIINGNATNGGAIFTNYGSSLELTNITFENNNATNGGAIYINTNNTATITESTFIDNNAKIYGGAIYVKIKSQYEEYAKLNITKSRFINNTSYKYSNSGAIYTDGITNINYCILLSNDENGLIYTSNLDYKLNATYNWWGTNTPNFNKLVECYYYEDSWEEDYFDVYEAEIDTSNWIIMNVTATIKTMNGGESQEITVEFTEDNNGNALEENIPELIVIATANIGTLNTTQTITKNNIAKFTYTAPNTGKEDTISFKSGHQTSNVTITLNNNIILEPTYTGVVYVSKASNANDNNAGSETAPVASITKAIEIASSETGSKEIIILDGTYIESEISINSNLTITGKGSVTWDANGTRAFRVYSGKVNISNIKFINGNSTSYGHLFRADNCELIIDNCKFVSNGGTVSGSDGVIYVKNANFKLINCIFENNTATPTGTSYGIIQTTNTTLYVDNCNFTNNHNKYGVFYITANYDYNAGSNAIIKNSKFIGNNATSSSGGLGAAIYLSGNAKSQTILTIENCEFINNSAKYGTYSDYQDYHPNATSGKGGAIHVNNNATLIVLKSKFINNSALASPIRADGEVGGGAIFASGGNITIIESLFENNFAERGSEIYMDNNTFMNGALHMLNVTKSTFNNSNPFKLIESNYSNGKLFAIGNTWINTEDPSTRVSEGIIVKDGKIDPTITINVNSPIEGENATITVNTGDATGNVTITLEGKEPQTINITNGIATLNTTELTAGTYNITVTYNGDNNYKPKTENTTITIKSKTTPPGPGPTPTNVVSPETISNFFDENGVLKEDAPNELIFNGEFNDLTLTINKPVNITGDNAVFNNSALNITANNVKVSNIKFVADENFDKTALITTNGTNTTIENNSMTITGNTETTGIFAENATITVNNNNITTANNKTMILNNTNGTLNNNKLNTENNINGSATISHKGSNITVDNKPLTEPEKTETKEPEKPTTPEQNKPTTPEQNKPTTPEQSQTQEESENSIPAKLIKITTPKTPKKISKRAKKLTISVKLKIRGKIAKNKKVKIIFKGKKYTRKTNKKGIAKLTFKKAKLRKILRKIKVGKKITYKVKYGKKTIKRSLKIKK